MNIKTIKYFSTLIVFAAALLAGWLLWNYYMQSPWTRDGKVRAEQVSITPQVSGTIVTLNVKDNQFVSKGTTLFTLDTTPYHIAVLKRRGAAGEGPVRSGQSQQRGEPPPESAPQLHFCRRHGHRQHQR
ncbi:p-hydroxybenzoic acid efflux subunit AaeA [Cedecea neteri]|uniref:p-hydroxybenzoic acid efflux subunit AaeA n=1 Tax=Cedecea neteri TaxID=158822 RepID=A0A2X3KZR0_9ENTR|nr:p-hydroxybenzoic acid efflux subunit AaeA [Cedecea neteri]